MTRNMFPFRLTLLNIFVSIVISLGTGYISGKIVTIEAEKRSAQERDEAEKHRNEERILELFHEGERWFKFEQYAEAINAYERISTHLDKIMLDREPESLNLVTDDQLRHIYITTLLHLKDSYHQTSHRVRDNHRKRQLLQDMLTTYEKMGTFEKKNPLWFITQGLEMERSSRTFYLNSLEEIGNISLEILKTYEHQTILPENRAYIETIFATGMKSYKDRIKLMEHYSMIGPDQEAYIRQLHAKIHELGTTREYILQ